MKGDYVKDKQPLHTKARMLSYLERLQNAGVEFFMDGEEMLPGDVFRRTVQEQYTYMADYVLGENGTVKEVRFDRVEP